MTPSDIKREQANAGETLGTISLHIATSGPLSSASVMFLTEEAEGAFNGYKRASIGIDSKNASYWEEDTSKKLAKEYIKSCINNRKNLAR